MNTQKPIVIARENDSLAGNIMRTNAKKVRAFGKELHNKKRNEFTEKSKKVKVKEGETDETRERALTSLNLTKPSVQVLEEYYQNITQFLIKKDTENSIRKDYMHSQKDINSKMRAILVDWLVDVHQKFELLPQTFFSCIQLLDRYLEKKKIIRTHLQLIGICCLMIVSKIEEVYSPMVKDYLAVCDNAYTRRELLEMESEILLIINFNVLCPTSYDFLMNYNAKIQIEEKLFYYAQYLLETSLLELNYLKHNSAFLAAGAIFFTNKIFKKEGWSSENERITGMTEAQIKSAAKDLFIILQKTEKSELKAMTKKFSDPQFFEASKYTVQKNVN